MLDLVVFKVVSFDDFWYVVFMNGDIFLEVGFVLDGLVLVEVDIDLFMGLEGIGGVIDGEILGMGMGVLVSLIFCLRFILKFLIYKWKKVLERGLIYCWNLCYSIRVISKIRWECSSERSFVLSLSIVILVLLYILWISVCNIILKSYLIIIYKEVLINKN